MPPHLRAFGRQLVSYHEARHYRRMDKKSPRKNLGHIFDRAADMGAFLFFDEADALFVRKAAGLHEKEEYPEPSLPYLLQRIEDYRGLVVLSAKRSSSLSPALRRRAAFEIAFSRHDEER